MRASVMVAAVVLVVCGCRKTPSVAERGAQPAVGVATAGSAVQQPGFDVKVRLSPRAKAELVAKNETIVVDASFVAGPKAGTPKKYIGEDGQVTGLGDQRLEVAPGTTARFAHLLANREALAWAEGPPAVLINVYSGRKASKNNLLDCGVYEGPLSTIADSVVPIDCKLIGE